MALAAGDKLGPYEILGLIGAGGMGEVFRARDTRLNRDVAVKVSSEQFSERFEREARVIASLNHPNICTLHDVGPNYLVMELVEGPTLAERISEGAVPLDESLDIAKQIAAALDAAHEKGIVHRDLKPGNVKIKPDGVVKVLDFGLAKTGGTPTIGSDNSPTLTIAQTEAGVILGTASYMSPEQAKGKTVDKRADIYSYGVVLYEMLAGRRLHRGESITEVLASVIKEEPRWEKIPTEVQPLLRRCLEKDPKQRLHDIADARLWLEQGSGTAFVAPAQPGSSRTAWGAAALFLVLAAVSAPFALQHFRETPPVVEPARFQIPAPPKTNFDIYTSLAPNGHRVAFTAAGTDSVVRLWIRDLDTLEARMLPGTEGANSPFWSPDSRFIAFGVGNQVKKIDSAGGPPQTLCQAPLPITIVGSGAWSPDGVLLFGNRGGGPLLRVAAAGGVPSPVTTLDPSRQETYHTQPSFLADGRHFLYFRQTGAPEHVGVYVGSLDAKPAEQPLKRILDVRFGASFVPTPNSTLANVLFLRDGTLMAQPFDSGKLELSGDPVPVAEQVSGTNTYGNFSGSPNGVLAYRTGNPGANQLTWHDRQGKQSGTAGEPGNFLNIALSPDASRVAVQRPDRDLWLLDIARGVSTRFTFNPAIDGAPVWSPDGSQIVFRSNRNNGKFDLYVKPSNGASEEIPLLQTDRDKLATSWSHDGRFLLFESDEAKTQSDIWVLPLEGERKPVPVLQTQFDEWFATFSPDGKWIAYLSNASGRTEVYVRPFAPPGSTASLGGQWQISKDGAINNLAPHWRADQKEIYFRGSGGPLMAVDLNTSPSFQSGVPHPLFNLTTAIQGDMTSDGKRILLAIPQGSATPSPITVVLNWQAALRK